MHLAHLSCLNYRNIEECDLSFSPKFNCFMGDNGMGKTNALDAIYFLAITKSHLASLDSQLVRHDAQFMMAEGQYIINGNQETIQAAIRPHVKKIIKRNGKAYTRMADHIGLIPVVLISPFDQDLIREGSEARRRFADIVISQCDHRYLDCLTRYNILLKNRNDLLKKMSDNVAGADAWSLLDVFDLKLEAEAAYVYQKRAHFIDEFRPHFSAIYERIAGSTENVDLAYTSHLAKGNLTAMLSECRSRDIILGYTTRGIHKDDLAMTIDGYPVKTTASQGQNKTLVTALKLAEYQYLAQSHGRAPLLLLDDLFDRLDRNRVSNIIDLVSSDEFGQIFITDTTRNNIDTLFRGRESAIYRVEEGRFSAL